MRSWHVLSVSKHATGAIRVLLSFIGMVGFMPWICRPIPSTSSVIYLRQASSVLTISHLTVQRAAVTVLQLL